MPAVPVPSLTDTSFASGEDPTANTAAAEATTAAKTTAKIMLSFFINDVEVFQRFKFI
jgi:hypothetical protein